MTERDAPVESSDSAASFPYHGVHPPDLVDVRRAKRVVESRLPPTPVVRNEPLSAELEADVYLKREDVLPTGAFKVRGSIHLVGNLEDRFHDCGVVAASTGNYGLAVAYAGREFDVPVVVGVPESADPDKVHGMERLGADVRHRGEDYDEAREWVEREAREQGYRYLHSANESALIAGFGTAGLEIVNDLPEVDAVVCPVGSGAYAAAHCLTVGELVDAEVVGVQAAGADAMYRAWKEGHSNLQDSVETIADGIALRTPFDLPMGVLRKRLDEMLVVDDAKIREEVCRMVETNHVVAEPASAASVAAMRQARDRFVGKTVVVPISGRNISLEKLTRILQAERGVT